LWSRGRWGDLGNPTLESALLELKKRRQLAVEVDDRLVVRFVDDELAWEGRGTGDTHVHGPTHWQGQPRRTTSGTIRRGESGLPKTMEKLASPEL